MSQIYVCVFVCVLLSSANEKILTQINVDRHCPSVTRGRNGKQDKVCKDEAIFINFPEVACP